MQFLPPTRVLSGALCVKCHTAVENVKRMIGNSFKWHVLDQLLAKTRDTKWLFRPVSSKP